VRAARGSPARLSGALAAALGEVDAGLSVSFQTVAEQLDVFSIRERLLALLAGFFGAFALLLAAAGLYGVMSDAVNRRRAEIGIRMALGAEPMAVLRMILRRVAALAAIGIAAGVLATWWAARLLTTLLYEVQPLDTGTLLIAAGVLATASVIAGWAARAPRHLPRSCDRAAPGLSRAITVTARREC
jgi:ABC-type antimicrobial peptide transport system permease subunit